MKRDLLALLASPCCRTDLKFARLGEFPVLESSEIDSGALACTACGAEYPIAGGVPRLVAGAQSRDVEKTRDSFAWEWQRYPGSLPEDERIFLEEAQIGREELHGKLVLDAGCGMGRYSLVAYSLGAEVVALDLSDAVLCLVDEARKRPKLHLVQGDLLHPPLKRAKFDFVYSHGVLHHTSDTKKAFEAVSDLVKPEGKLSVWLYGKAGRFADFATNPLKFPNGWVGRHRRLTWLIVAIRHFYSDFIRLFTTRLPTALVYALCYPLTILGAIPGIKYLTFSVHPDFQVRLIENFDWIAPPYQYHHTKEELLAWYEAAGFDALKVLPHGFVPKPGVLGKRRRR